MSLQYLSGIGAPKKNKVQKVQAKQAKQVAKIQAKQQVTAAKTAASTAKKTQKIQARGTAQQARQVNRQTLVTKSAPVKVLKAVAKQSPLAAQKIKKAAVQQKQRKAFKQAAEPVKIAPELLEVEEAYNLPVEVEEGTQEVNEPEFFDDMDAQEEFSEDMDDMGIIYPYFGAPKKKLSKKTVKKQAPKKSAVKAPTKKSKDPVKKAKRQEAVKKLSAGVLNVAKATLEAKGIKFPTKEQVETEAQSIQPETKKNSYLMPVLIGGGLIGLVLYLKK